MIASQQAITASPISAATVALLGLLNGFELYQILMITIPATMLGVLIGSLFSMKVGKELLEDPEYQRRVREGMIEENSQAVNKVENPRKAKLSIILFIIATVAIVIFGSIPSLRPSFGGKAVEMPAIIEILMLSTCAIILLCTGINGIRPTQGSVFIAGMQAVIAIFGIAWMGNTFLNGNMAEISGAIKDMVSAYPWLFGLALFVMSILLYSQAATVTTAKHTVNSIFDVTNLTELPKVGIVYAYANVDADVMTPFLTCGYKGIIHAGLGNGNYHKNLYPELQKARKQGIIVVRSSRVPTGPTTLWDEVDDEAEEFVAAWELNPQKARVLLMLALTQTNDWRKIQQYFEEY